MRTKISAGNPFGHDRYGFLWEVLRERNGLRRHLDFGARDGAVLQMLVDTGLIDEGVGVEASSAHVARHGPNLRAGVELVHLSPGSPLPFHAETFDSASLLDVYEHVADQRFLLRELFRVLKPGGTLVVTVPKSHVFSVLDPGNFKFRWPRAHRWVYVARNSRASYEARYSRPPDGLYGDIEVGKMWHQHFTPGQLSKELLAEGFGEVGLDGAGFWARPLTLIALLVGVESHPVLAKLHAFDFLHFSSTHLFCVARRGTSSAAAPGTSTEGRD